jgi:hypothetical protein
LCANNRALSRFRVFTVQNLSAFRSSSSNTSEPFPAKQLIGTGLESFYLPHAASTIFAAQYDDAREERSRTARD